VLASEGGKARPSRRIPWLYILTKGSFDYVSLHFAQDDILIYPTR